MSSLGIQFNADGIHYSADGIIMAADDDPCCCGGASTPCHISTICHKRGDCCYMRFDDINSAHTGDCPDLDNLTLDELMAKYSCWWDISDMPAVSGYTSGSPCTMCYCLQTSYNLYRNQVLARTDDSYKAYMQVPTGDFVCFAVNDPTFMSILYWQTKWSSTYTCSRAGTDLLVRFRVVVLITQDSSGHSMSRLVGVEAGEWLSTDDPDTDDPQSTYYYVPLTGDPIYTVGDAGACDCEYTYDATNTDWINDDAGDGDLTGDFHILLMNNWCCLDPDYFWADDHDSYPVCPNVGCVSVGFDACEGTTTCDEYWEGI